MFSPLFRRSKPLVFASDLDFNLHPKRFPVSVNHLLTGFSQGYKINGYSGIPHWGHSQETLLQTANHIHLSYPKYWPTSVTAHVPPESYSSQYILLWPCNCHTSGSRPRMLHVPTRYKISISQCSCPSLGLGTPRMEWEGLYFFDIVLQFGLRSGMPPFFLMNSLLLLNGSFELKSIFPRLFIY